MSDSYDRREPPLNDETLSKALKRMKSDGLQKPYLRKQTMFCEVQADDLKLALRALLHLMP